MKKEIPLEITNNMLPLEIDGEHFGFKAGQEVEIKGQTPSSQKWVVEGFAVENRWLVILVTNRIDGTFIGRKIFIDDSDILFENSKIMRTYHGVDETKDIKRVLVFRKIYRWSSYKICSLIQQVRNGNISGQLRAIFK